MIVGQLKKRIAVLTGAGISAESGLGTFRDSGGLWENYDISKVATINAWHQNPAMVLAFYNARRRQVIAANPNEGHYALAALEDFYDVTIITQNIDDLHERAGSSTIIHLHGEILKGRGVDTDKILYPLDGDIELHHKTPNGQRMRPHIVWFGEAVPKMQEAEMIVRGCEILIVIGTSLNVYPAAGLRYASPNWCEKYLIDPGTVEINDQEFEHFKGPATVQVPLLVDHLISKAKKS
jgi:NAD-dependent deacetylase